MHVFLVRIFRICIFLIWWELINCHVIVPSGVLISDDCCRCRVDRFRMYAVRYVLSRAILMILGSRPKYSRTVDVTALVVVSLDRGRVGGPFYVILVIDRWAWPAHGSQMCCFLLFISAFTL